MQHKFYTLVFTIFTFLFTFISCAYNTTTTNTKIYNHTTDVSSVMSENNELLTSTTVSETVEPTNIEISFEPYFINDIVFSNIIEHDPKVTQIIEEYGNIRYLQNLHKSFDLYADETNKKYAACLLLFYETETDVDEKLHSQAIEKRLLYNGKNADELLKEYNKSLDKCYKVVDELLNSGKINAEIDEKIRNEFIKTEPAHIAYKNLLFSEIYNQLRESGLIVIELKNPIYNTYSYGNFPTCIVVGTKEQLDNSMIYDDVCWIYGLGYSDELKITNNTAFENIPTTTTKSSRTTTTMTTVTR